MFEKKLPLSLLWLLIHLLFLSCAFSSPLEDPLSSLKFNIIYAPSVNDTLDLLTQSYGNGTLLTLGDDMKCFIPRETKMSLLQQINNNVTMWNQLLQDSLSEGLNILDSNMHSKCFFHKSGFWKYQFCYGRDFLQYHNSPSDTEFVNKLGSFVGINNASVVTLIFDNEIGYYISEFLEPGDVCDLTGKKREVEVQYVCGLNKDSPTLQWVREISTCLYEARIMVPGLCSLELFAKNEDKLSATQIVCQRSGDQHSKNFSDLYAIEGGIVNIVAKFEPTFLNNGIFLLTPVNTNQKLVYLLYTGEIADSDVMKSALFKKFGNAFNTMIARELLKGPNNETITLNHRFEWWAPVIDSDGQLLFTVNFKMLSGGNAELYLKSKKEKQLPTKKTNFITFNLQDEDGTYTKSSDAPPQTRVKDNMVVNEKNLDIKVDGNKATLILKDTKDDIVSMQRTDDSEDHLIFLVNILDENGEPIPMNIDATTNELLMDLFENYDMESIIEQLKNSVVVNDNFNNEEGGINFISSQVGKQSDVHIDKSEVYHFETEDKFIFDDPDRNYEDISLQNIESDLVSEDEDHNHYHVNEGFLPTEGSISETVRKERQIEGNYLDMTLLEEGRVTEIEEQPDIKWSKKISSTEKDEIISETMGSQNVDSIETAI